MTPAETAKMLAKAAAYDLRTVGENDVLAWHEVLTDVDFRDALEAVARHYAERTERLMPAHVRRLAHDIDHDRRSRDREARERAERLALASDPTRRDRSTEVYRLIAELRATLPEGHPEKLRRTEWVEHDKAVARAARAEPNPHYAGQQPPAGGHAVPDDAGA